MITRALILCLATAAPALARDGALSPSEFAALTTGKAYAVYDAAGNLRGYEEYLPGRSVIWQYASGECLFGKWKVQGGSVCYSYENLSGSHCLRYAVQGGKLTGETWWEEGPTGEVETLVPSSGDLPYCPAG